MDVSWRIYMVYSVVVTLAALFYKYGDIVHAEVIDPMKLTVQQMMEW